jgi:hypothetical protein
MGYVVIYSDHRGWKNIEGQCDASVMGARRSKQCSRKATTDATVKSFDGATAGTMVAVRLCAQHAQAKNVAVNA